MRSSRSTMWALGLLLTTSLHAQFHIIAGDPAEGATGVPHETAICLTFSADLDTTQRFSFNGNDDILLPVGFLVAEPQEQGQLAGWTWDGATRAFCLNVLLADYTDFYLLIDRARSTAGEELAAPFELHFSTDWTMGERSVSTVVARMDFGSPLGAVVGLFDAFPLGEEEGELRAATVIDSDTGEATIPYVRDGVYYPVAVMDLDGNGSFDLEAGDLFGFYDGDEDGTPDSVVVAGEDLSGLGILLFSMGGSRARDHLAEAAALAASFAQVQDAELKTVISMGETLDDQGGCLGWSYQFHTATLDTWIHVFYAGDMPMVELGPADWPVMETLPWEFVDSDVALSAALANGGAEVEQELQDPARSAMLGNFHWLWPQDPQACLWAVHITGWSDLFQWRDHLFLIDALTGEFLDTWEADLPAMPEPTRPAAPMLAEPWPNPFNPVTHLGYELAAPQAVRLSIHNLAGQCVAVLVDGPQAAGRHETAWDAAGWAGGLYLARLEAGGRSVTRKLMLVK